MYNQSIVKEAQGHWVEILSSNGIDQKFLQNTHGPCPICGGKNRFRFDDKEGRGTFICNRCGAGDGIQLLMLHHNCDFNAVSAMIRRTLGSNINLRYSGPRLISHILPNVVQSYSGCTTSVSANDSEKRRLQLYKTWDMANPITPSDPVQCYLLARGIDLNSFPTTLKYHSALPYYEEGKLIGTFTAMLGLVTDENNQPVTLHRTFLENCKKADVSSPKKLMPPIYPKATTGASIKLCEPHSGQLAVSEGIETGLSFFLATKIPVWAAISAYGMQNIIIPREISDIVIIVDNDESGTGQKAAGVLADRLLKEGRNVRRVIPSKPGQDFNDVILEDN